MTEGFWKSRIFKDFQLTHASLKTAVPDSKGPYGVGDRGATLGTRSLDHTRKEFFKTWVQVHTQWPRYAKKVLTHPHPTHPRKRVPRYRWVEGSKLKTHWGIILSPKMMILLRVRHLISCLGVCYVNDPQEGGGDMVSTPGLDLTTSFRRDFPCFKQLSKKSIWYKAVMVNGLCVSVHLADSPGNGHIIKTKAFVVSLRHHSVPLQRKPHRKIS